MKSVRFICMLGVAAFLSAVMANKSSAQYENCWPECTVVASGAGSETIELPGYPGCSITYVYSWRRCSDGKVYFGERKFYWQFPVGDECEDYFNDLYDGNEINETFANWVFETGLTIIQERAFMTAYNAAEPWEKFQFECPNGKQDYYGVKASCGSIWLKTRSFGPFGLPFYEIGFLPCDGTACCVKKTTICFNTVTQQTEITESWEYLPSTDPDCHLTTPPSPPSGGTLLFQTPCFVLCGN